MIKNLHIKNFKSIKNHIFSLQNLNILLGLNGMGKSSFIQSLLLLRQSNNLNKGVLNLIGQHFNIGTGKDAFYQFSKDNRITLNLSFSNSYSHDFEFEYQSDADYLKSKIEHTIEPDFFSQSLFNQQFKYISASRIDPIQIHGKSYSNVIDNKSLGDRGQYTVHFLKEYGDSEIAFTNLKHKDSVSLLLNEQVNKWMGEISPGATFCLTEIPNSDFILLDIKFEQANLGFTDKYKPTNVGFGISYSLPIITTLLSAQPNDLIIIENPESHIHPRGQAELGKLIALTAENGVQVIVETHSDHILNGIRVATKEKVIDSKHVGLFYFEKKIADMEQYSQITNIEIDRNGELSEYPTNLLDEFSNQLIKLV